MGNKNTEIDCLNLVIKECKKQHGFSKTISKLFLGVDVPRKTTERPDFLKHYKSQNTNEKDVIIGIEHFRVDQYSRELKDNRIGSFGIRYENNLKTTSEKWHGEIETSSHIPEEAISDIGSLVKEHLELRIQATYNAFVETFKYTLNKHIQSIDAYYASIDKYAENCDKKLAFLIEIHSGFDELFFHDNKGIHHGTKTVPLFEELVTLLEKIDSKKVHYLVLCFGGIVYGENVNVIAVPTQNIRKQLMKRHFSIYQYIGEDIFLSRFQTPRLDMKTSEKHYTDGENIHFNVQVTSRDIKADQQLKMIMDCYNQIKTLETCKTCYATTYLVELFYFCYDEYYPFLFDSDGEANTDAPAVLMKNNQNKIDTKFEKFKEKWNIHDN